MERLSEIRKILLLSSHFLHLSLYKNSLLYPLVSSFSILFSFYLPFQLLHLLYSTFCPLFYNYLRLYTTFSFFLTFLLVSIVISSPRLTQLLSALYVAFFFFHTTFLFSPFQLIFPLFATSFFLSYSLLPLFIQLLSVPCVTFFSVHSTFLFSTDSRDL